MILTLSPRMPDMLRGRVVDTVLGEVIEILQQRCAGRLRMLRLTGRFVLTHSGVGAVRATVMAGSLDLRDPASEDELLRSTLAFLSTSMLRDAAA